LANGLPGLEPDEHLLVRAPASFRGATVTSISSTFALGSARKRLEAYNAWAQQAGSAGFRTDGPEMVLGLTETRLLVWKTTFWMNRPGAIAGEIALEKVHDVAATRHGMVTGLAIALKTGQIVEVEAMRGRRLRHLAEHMQGLISPY
jgi:hypothetical protein